MTTGSFKSQRKTPAFKSLPWVCCVVILAVPFVVGWLDSPKRFPHDLQWWKGRVLKNFVWHNDGNQDILTEEGHYVVVDWPRLLEPGDSFYLLHAASDDGGQRTFFCTERKREACGSLSLAVNPPFDADTLNQGFVPASAREVATMGKENPKLSTLGHFVHKGERDSADL